MLRLIVCLPVCLLLAPAYPSTPLAPRQGKTEEIGKERLPVADPVAFLEQCLQRYDRAVKAGYTLTMRKRERVGDELLPLERIAVSFKGAPHSVFFKWLEGARRAERVLYVKGENNDRMLVMPTIRIAGVVARELDSPDAKQSGRYTIAEFGLKMALQRLHTSWTRARVEKVLKVEYLGIHRVPETGDRPCYKLAAHYGRPERDGVTEVTVYIDTETWLQVGSVLHDSAGRLVAEYFFRDIRLDPAFPPEQFTRAALTSK